MRSLEHHREFVRRRSHSEFILFGDNILECFSVLNRAVEQADIWAFEYVVYEPIDQPIYVFSTSSGSAVTVKACGNYSNWALPPKVADLIYRYDLPDFVLYNIEADKVILAGELTETASVGNSQWQRELRKIAAAELGVPFVYQTIYSGTDTSQSTIREPTSLLAYNALLYSLRYRVASLVFFIEPNVPSSRSRDRSSNLDPNLLSTWFVAHILAEVDDSHDLLKAVHTIIFESMVSYLRETPYVLLNRGAPRPRLEVDLPSIDPKVENAILSQSSDFVDDLVRFLFENSDGQEDLRFKYDLASLTASQMVEWTDKRNTLNLADLFSYFEREKYPHPKAPRPKFAVGIFDSAGIVQFLKAATGDVPDETLAVLDEYPETLVIPVAFHKLSNGKLQFTKDPYAGNTAAFAELFAYGTDGTKNRAVVTYCVSRNPPNFDFHKKSDTNLYRAVAKYSDALLIDSRELITTFKEPKPIASSQEIISLDDIEPVSTSEDMAVVSTYLQMGVIGSEWDVCMIAIHHSSWQQMRITDAGGEMRSTPIGRNSSKLDLVMQGPGGKFLAAEGKKKYTDFFSSEKEQQKIKAAFKNVLNMIDTLYMSPGVEKTCAFLCLLDVPALDNQFFLDAERSKIQGSITAGHLEGIAPGPYVVIGYYSVGSESFFELFFSDHFPEAVVNELSDIFLR